MITVNWISRVISIPQSYLTNLGGGVYELDVDQFRLDLKDLEDDAGGGIIYPQTHNHNTAVTLSGVTYARIFEIINGYTVEFENGSYTVRCVGANHNLGDVKVVNSVSLVIGNSAGLIEVATGSGPTPAEIADAVWDEQKSGHTTANSYGKIVQDIETQIKKLKTLVLANS